MRSRYEEAQNPARRPFDAKRLIQIERNNAGHGTRRAALFMNPRDVADFAFRGELERVIASRIGRDSRH